jgi:homopolymeric O-antigen transport system ATP-binding protein
MEDDVRVLVENVSKKFCRRLKTSLFYGVNDLVHDFVGKERKHELRKHEFWAIDDVSLEIKRGEICGLIGPNGSGKTTLLRMLNGLILPDKGRIAVKGKIGALIQLGAGFSPVLTGRENININAAVLGIKKSKINNLIDEIVDFAEIEEFIDSPVRTYSSGMKARLGFAVAIHMQPDVLLIDEILAVGDMRFRNKALNKMTELTSSGAAVIFVSHNLAQVARICSKGLFIEKGKPIISGNIIDVVGKYVTNVKVDDNDNYIHEPGTSDYLTVERVIVNDVKGSKIIDVSSGASLNIEVEFEAKQKLKSPLFVFMIEPYGTQIIAAYISQSVTDKRPSFEVGKHKIHCSIPDIPLLPDRYQLRMSLFDETGLKVFGKISNLSILDIVPRPDQYTFGSVNGYVELKSSWTKASNEI